MIAAMTEELYVDLSFNIKELEKAMDNGDDEALVRTMKMIIPEYKSSVSRFQRLDKRNGHKLIDRQEQLLS